MEVWTRIDAPIQAFTTFKLSCVRYHRRSASDYEPTQLILIGLLTVSMASCHKTPEGSTAAEDTKKAAEAVKEPLTSNADATAKDLEPAQAAAEKKAAEKEAAARIKAALTPAPSPAPAAPPATPAVPK